MKIRNGVWETNSSSMHSFIKLKENCIKEKEFKHLKVLLKKDKFVFEDGEDLEFGWGFEVTNEFEQKLAYAIASYQSVEEVLNALEDTNIQDIKLPIIINDDGEEEEYFGHIDHQSYGDLQRFFHDEGISLKEFLLNPQYAIIIDNDNSCSFEGHYVKDYVKKIEKFYGMHKEDIPYLKSFYDAGYTYEQLGLEKADWEGVDVNEFFGV